MESQAVGNADDANVGPAVNIAAGPLCPLCSKDRPLIKLRKVPGLRIDYHIAVCEDCA